MFVQDMDSTIRVILFIMAIGLVGGGLAVAIGLIFRKASRLLVLIPGIVLYVLAIAAAAKGLFFATGAWDDLIFVLIAMLLGGGATIAMLTGLIIILTRRRQDRKKSA